MSSRLSLRLGRVAGVDIELHVTFLIFLAWIVLALFITGGSEAEALAAVLTVTILFGLVVLHELGHALAARRFGAETRRILLLPIGGVAQVDRMPSEPRREALVAVAGPAVNLALAGAFYLVGRLLGEPTSGGPFLGASLVATLVNLNLSLAAFNLLPAFPLDGGRILRALLSIRLGEARATRIAVRLGQALAVAIGVAGLLVSPMLVLIAAFVWVAARQEEETASLRRATRGVPVSRIMMTSFATLPAEAELEHELPLLFTGPQRDFPVLADGRLVGMLERTDAIRAQARLAAHAPLSAAMRASRAVRPGADLEQILEELDATRGRALPVVEGDRVVGLVTAEQLAEWFSLRQTRGGPPDPAHRVQPLGA